MPSYVLPAVSTLSSLPAQERAIVFLHLFEPSEALNELIVDQLAENTFNSYTELIQFVRQSLSRLKVSGSTSDTERLLKILAVHPRLGDKKVDSEHSKKEQASLTGSEEEAEQLKRLNDEYEQTFPGMRYVVFVNGRSRPVIMENMRQRIARGDIEAEKTEAINAMCDIAEDRARQLASQTSKLA
ncbi:Oxo-4-hydroxy-4-carboxy-5-ureidoimidazoline decarboxylase [Kalaharituber pfeilii]|nr:Oxo-4-hydroxy-4-carboxy-5-ureidoimidazoline decarboxylase [Kalaharituber pfeilii]